MFFVLLCPLVMLELDVEHVQLLGVVHRHVLQDLREVLLNSIADVQSELVSEIFKENKSCFIIDKHQFTL